MRVVTGLLTYQFVLNASWGHNYFIRIFVIIKQDKNVLITLRSGFSTCPGIFGIASSVLKMKNIVLFFLCHNERNNTLQECSNQSIQMSE